MKPYELKIGSCVDASEERLAWYRMEIKCRYDYASSSKVFQFSGTFEDDRGRSHRIDGGFFDHVVIMGDSDVDPDGVYAHFTSMNKEYYSSREYDWYAVERTRICPWFQCDILVVGVLSKKSLGVPSNKETFDRIMRAMFGAHVKNPDGDHDVVVDEPKQSFNLADIRYVKRVGDRLFGNTVCGEWANLGTNTKLVTSLSGKIERDGDDFSVCPESLEDEVSYTCHYWPEKDCLVLDDFGEQLVEKHGCRGKLVKLSVIDTNGNFTKLRIGRMVKFEQMAILKMYSDAGPHSCRETPKTGSEPYGPLYYAEVCVYDPHKQLSEVDPDKLYDISLAIVPDELEPRFVLNARDQIVIRNRQGGKTMHLHAMYLEAVLAADVRTRKNAGCSVPKIERVIFNAPAVIVMWADGSKTVVKAQKGEKYDAEKGLAMAIAKKALGNGSKYYDTFKAWVPEKKKPARKPRAKKTPAEE